MNLLGIWAFVLGMTRGTRGRAVAGTVVLAAGLTVACGDLIVLAEEPPTVPTTCLLSDDGQAPRVNFFTFWTAPPDSDAVVVLRDRVEELGGRYAQAFLQSRSDLQAEIADGAPPSEGSSETSGSAEDAIYQVNGGSDVLQFALPEAATSVCSLEPLFSEFDVRETFFEAAWRPSECQGVPLAMPLSVHRVNTVMVNTSLYEELVTLSADTENPVPPFSELSSTEDLLNVLEFAHTAGLTSPSGNAVVPLALCVGTDPESTWPLHHVAFESVLASYSDRSYEAIWQGEAGLSTEEKRAAVARLAGHLARLGAVSHLGAGYDALCGAATPDKVEWQEAPRMVIEGEALLTIGGDWMRALREAKDSDGVVTYAFPSEEETFAYTPDSFTVPPQEGSQGSSARRWFLDVVGDLATQVEFAKAKEAIPARSDVAAADLESIYLEGSYEQFRACHEEDSTCRLLLAVSGLGPAAGTDACSDNIGMLLAAVVGVEYDAAQWEASGCSAWQVEGEIDPASELTDLLLAISEEPFARDCRQP